MTSGHFQRLKQKRSWSVLLETCLKLISKKLLESGWPLTLGTRILFLELVNFRGFMSEQCNFPFHFLSIKEPIILPCLQKVYCFICIHRRIREIKFQLKSPSALYTEQHSPTMPCFKGQCCARFCTALYPHAFTSLRAFDVTLDLHLDKYKMAEQEVIGDNVPVAKVR